MPLCLIALGANIGDRAATLARAVAHVSATPDIVVRAQSALHETLPIGGPPGQAAYLNGVVAVETSLQPHDLLARLRVIEATLGRRRDVRWGPRTIDLDLLLYDQLVLSSDELTLPHPRMAFRRFVVEPAAEIAADVRHPTIGWTLKALAEHLRNAVPYVAITGPAGVGKSLLAERLAAATSARMIVDPREQALGAAKLAAAEHASSRGDDSAGRVYDAEIELLSLRRQLLEARAWSASRQLAVGDFWIPQSLGYAAVWDNDALRRELRGAIAEAVAAVVPPKLLILLNPPARDAARADATTRDVTCIAEAVRQALATAARRPGIGPLLELTGTDADANLAEALAAVAAMS